MGNNKFFKLSDMIPNAWFYKLKDMSKTKSKKPNNSNKNKNDNQNKKLTVSPITTTTTKTTIIPKQIHDPPRKSSKRRSTSSSRRRKPVFKPHSRINIASNSSTEEELNSSESENDDAFLRLSSSTADIIIDLKSYDPSSVVKPAQNNNNNKNDVVVSDYYDTVNVIDLPPILTKPINFDDTVFEATKNYRSQTKTITKRNSSSSSNSSLSVKVVREDHRTHHHNQNLARKCSISSSAGIRIRSANSPRLAAASRKVAHRKSVSYSRNKQCLSESFAVVKSSVDPQRDFRDSMVEMIVENNIRASKDLEELLACFLSLNSKEYHDVIVNAFEQIWFDMSDIRM